MSQANSKFINLSDKKGSVFWGGVVDNLMSWKLSYKNSPYARNFRLTDWGISIRPWFYQYWADITWSDYPRGIWAYYRSVIANDRIILRHNVSWTVKLVSVVPSTWVQTSITTGALVTSDNRMNFLNANDSMYCYNWVDLIGKLSWTTYTNPTATLTPSFWVWFNNSAWISWDSSNPNTFYKSNTNDPETFSWAWWDIFKATTPIVWLCASLETLYIFSESYIDMMNSWSIKDVWGTLAYTSVPLESMEWAMNHNNIVNYWKNVFFLTKSWKIKRVTPWNQTYDVIDVSHREDNGITNTMDTLDSDQTDGFAYAIPEKQLIKWHLKTKWSSYNDLCIIYDVENDEFIIDDHKVFYGWINYKTQNFTISQIEPKLYIDEDWATDDDTPIQFVYHTKVFNLWNPTILKTLWQTRLFLSLNTIWVIKQEIYADWWLVDTKTINSATIPQAGWWLGTEEIGTEEIGTEWFEPSDILYETTIVRDKGYLRVKAKNFQIRYTSWTLWTQCLLQQLTIQAEQLNFLTTSTF